MIYNKGDKMSSIEALKRIKRKYKYLIVKEIHRLPSNSNINIENVEEYWHKENNYDFSQIEKDLEILEIFKKNISVKIETRKMGYVFLKNETIAYNGHDLIMKNEEEFNKIKDWILK